MAVRITNRMIDNLIAGLRNGSVQPNHGDGVHHVFKIICGAGTHGKQGGVIKHKVKEALLLRSDIEKVHCDDSHGVFYVLLEK